MENIKILLNSAIIDFYIDKKKFNSYKNFRNQKNFVFTKLMEILTKIKGTKIDNIEIRDVSITSNNFWGQELYKINDLGYNFANQCEENKKFVTLRIFNIDIISVFSDKISDKDTFLNIKGDNFLIQSSSAKII
jgi:hypothetical protein